MNPITGFMQVTGVYNTGESFIQDKKLPFLAEDVGTRGNYAMIKITLAVPQSLVSSILAGLASGSDLTLDNVPTLLEQS